MAISMPASRQAITSSVNSASMAKSSSRRASRISAGGKTMLPLKYSGLGLLSRKTEPQ